MSNRLPRYITHYYRPDRLPFQNLMDIVDEAERQLVISALQASAKEKESRRSFPDWYLKCRIATEKRLREGHLAHGGKLTRQSPHYFVLGENDILAATMDGMKSVQLELESLPSEYISLTWPDSMATFELPEVPLPQKPWFGKVLTVQEVASFVNEFGLPATNEIVRYAHKGFANMIEVQVWCDLKL